MRFAVVALVAVPLAMASCHATYRPFDVADACNCGQNEYCRITSASVSSAAATRHECQPIPDHCTDPPTCACLGRREDACREELGRFWVFEPRPVAGCGECADEEYCSSATGHDATPVLCALLPAQCDGEPTCACIARAHHALAATSCTDRGGRVELGSVSSR
jgi:hypothetical protein